MGNGRLPVPDGETPPGAGKTSLKKLYELFEDTKSHGLVSLQFLSALNLFIGGSIENSKNAMSELYHNLTYETLSGAIEIQFEWISNLFSCITYKLHHSALLDTEKKGLDTKKTQ